MPTKKMPRERSWPMAVTALLSGRTKEEVAREAGTTARTLRRWLKNREFNQMLHAARRESFGHENERLQHGVSVAVNVVLKTLVDPKTKDSMRFNVAKFVIESTQKALEINTLEDRIASLEQQLAETKQAGGEPPENLNDHAEEPA